MGVWGPSRGPQYLPNEAPAAGEIVARHEDDDLALGADRERMYGVGDAGAQDGRDALAVQQALHHHRLGLIAAAQLDEAALVVGRRGCHAGARKRDDLAAAGHARIIPRPAEAGGAGAARRRGRDAPRRTRAPAPASGRAAAGASRAGDGTGCSDTDGARRGRAGSTSGSARARATAWSA